MAKQSREEEEGDTSEKNLRQGSLGIENQQLGDETDSRLHERRLSETRAEPSPQQREPFRQRIRERCGFEPASSESTGPRGRATSLQRGVSATGPIGSLEPPTAPCTLRSALPRSGRAVEIAQESSSIGRSTGLQNPHTPLSTRERSRTFVSNRGRLSPLTLPSSGPM